MPRKIPEGQEPKDHRMSVSGEYTLIEAFKNKCANNPDKKLTTSSVIREFMIKYLGEEKKYGLKKGGKNVKK